MEARTGLFELPDSLGVVLVFEHVSVAAAFAVIDAEGVTGKDAAQGKLTYPSLMGADAARARVDELLRDAIENAAMIAGPVNYLAPIARYICERRS